MGKSGPRPSVDAFTPTKPVVYLDSAWNADDRKIILEALQKLSSDTLTTEASGTEVYADGKGKTLPIGTKLLRSVQHPTKRVVIVSGMFSSVAEDTKDKDRILVRFSLSDILFFTQAASTEEPHVGIEVEKAPLSISLAHELIHANHFLRNTYKQYASMVHHFFDEPPEDCLQYEFKMSVRWEEMDTVGLHHRTYRPTVEGVTENAIRHEQGLALRTSYASPSESFEQQGVDTLRSTSLKPPWWPNYPH